MEKRDMPKRYDAAWSGVVEAAKGRNRDIEDMASFERIGLLRYSFRSLGRFGVAANWLVTSRFRSAAWIMCPLDGKRPARRENVMVLIPLLVLG